MNSWKFLTSAIALSSFIRLDLNRNFANFWFFFCFFDQFPFILEFRQILCLIFFFIRNWSLQNSLNIRLIFFFPKRVYLWFISSKNQIPCIIKMKRNKKISVIFYTSIFKHCVWQSLTFPFVLFTFC